MSTFQCRYEVRYIHLSITKHLKYTGLYGLIMKGCLNARWDRAVPFPMQTSNTFFNQTINLSINQSLDQLLRQPTEQKLF